MNENDYKNLIKEQTDMIEALYAVIKEQRDMIELLKKMK